MVSNLVGVGIQLLINKQTALPQEAGGAAGNAGAQKANKQKSGKSKAGKDRAALPSSDLS